MPRHPGDRPGHQHIVMPGQGLELAHVVLAEIGQLIGQLAAVDNCAALQDMLTHAGDHSWTSTGVGFPAVEDGRIMLDTVWVSPGMNVTVTICISQVDNK